MPTIDMPLEKLREYTGASPCPVDIDMYWDKALEEMRAVDPKVELVPAEFQVPFAECFHLYFTGVRGARIHAKYLRPKQIIEDKPAILQFHGYSGNSGDWSEKLQYVALGFSVFAMDCRGQGGFSEDLGGVKGNTLSGHIIRGLDAGAENLLFRHIFLDAAELASIAMTMPGTDSNEAYAMGGSQGGALTIACAALEPRVSRIAPVYPFLSDYKRVWDMDLAKDAFEDIKLYFRRFDPLHEREEEIFYTLGYIDLQNIAKRIRGEVLMATALMDTICPPSTQFATYNKIASPKQMLIYPDYGHENLPQFQDKTLEFFLK